MGKPIKEGSITFEDPTTGLADQAKLQDGAKYEIKLVNGNYRVSVEPLMEERTARADTPPDYVFKKADDIPARYRSGAESGLTHTVSSPGEFNVEMNSSKK